MRKKYSDSRLLQDGGKGHFYINNNESLNTFIFKYSFK